MARKSRQYTGCTGSMKTVRDFVRESFVYGIKDKSRHTEISPRVYDEHTRRMEDWFRECLQTRTVKIRNKIKYLSLNCRKYAVNPLHKIWKACSFTTNEIVFFFFLIDYLTGEEKAVTLSELYNAYSFFHTSDGFSYSAAQKWLQFKGCPSGMIQKDENGKYSLAPSSHLSALRDLLCFFSETAPAGVAGSFLLDKEGIQHSPFRFKQHYIGQTFDSEILCNVLYAIKNRRDLFLDYRTDGKQGMQIRVFPLKVYSGTQNGRQYLIAWDAKNERFSNYRLDRIGDIDISDGTKADSNAVIDRFAEVKDHMWGVSLGEGRLTQVTFSVTVDEDEAHIVQRLYREKRCGTVTQVKDEPGLFRFTAEVYDAREMFPWIRTFICRIVSLHISDSMLEKQFWDTMDEMIENYATVEKEHAAEE